MALAEISRIKMVKLYISMTLQPLNSSFYRVLNVKKLSEYSRIAHPLTKINRFSVRIHVLISI